MTFDAGRVPAVWLMPDVKRDHDDSPHRLTFDGAIVESLLDALGATHLVGFAALPEGEGAVVVIPGGYYASALGEINGRLAALPWCLVIVYADEGATFPDADLKHDNMLVWRQAPRPGQHTGTRFLPMGAPPDTPELLAGFSTSGRQWDWSFAGQVNHRRRREAVTVLNGMDQTRASLRPTRGFGRGMKQPNYLLSLLQSKIAPCPSGTTSADSFRVWEALAAGALPVVDGVCPEYGEGFWDMLFPDGPPPFPVVSDWSEFPALAERLLPWWPANATRCCAAYQRWLRDLKWRLADDIADLSGSPRHSRGNVTVLIPTSPIPSHPDTGIIEQTVGSVRHHFPDAEILILCDGLREEQEHYRPQYEEYLHRLVGLTGNRWGSCLPLIFDGHQHQANMTRQALELVRTPLVLFAEHDTPLVTDEPIDWAACEDVLLAGLLKVVRFHYEAFIPADHDYLMIDKAPIMVAGLACIRTRQWSQRPHLARTDYYRRMLRDPVWFPDDAVTMIEDVWHSAVMNHQWSQHRLAIYAPLDGHMKRSLNLDGRGDDPKYEMQFGTRADDWAWRT